MGSVERFVTEKPFRSVKKLLSQTVTIFFGMPLKNVTKIRTIKVEEWRSAIR